MSPSAFATASASASVSPACRDCGACTASGYCWESSAAVATAAAEAGYCWESSAAVATTAAGTSAAAATGANDEASGMNDMVWG